MKQIFLMLLIGFSTNTIAFFESKGAVSELRITTYWSEACIQVNGTWYYFERVDNSNNLMKSMILTSYASGKPVYAATGNSPGHTDKKCDSLQAYPLSILFLQ